MTLDVTGLLIFLLAFVPGFLTQQVRKLLIPRSLRDQSVLEETRNYIVNSLVVHLVVVTIFRTSLALVRSTAPAALDWAIAHHQFGVWSWDHRYLILAYFVASLFVGLVFGLFRGVVQRDRIIGIWLADNRWLSQFLVRLGVFAFLEEAPVWYEALKQKTRSERTFVRVKMKDNRGFYTGELKSYSIVSDSEPNKDFLLVNVSHKPAENGAYEQMDVDGVLLNFADAESVAFIKDANVD
jgi:hypothetical protein